jgi:hypothetical protein
MSLASSLLKNASRNFSTSASSRQSFSRLGKQRLTSSFWHRIHTVTQPVEYFNRLLAFLPWRAAGSLYEVSAAEAL